MRFSARLKAKQNNQPLIFDDVPRITRIGFIKQVMPDFIGDAIGSYGQVKTPLSSLETHEKFIALIREESDPWDFDPQSSIGALIEHLKCCEWANFFDFVELIHKLLIACDEMVPFGEGDHADNYKNKVNSLFEEDGIGWRLSDNSELFKQMPRVTKHSSDAAQKLLQDKFFPARIHFKKAETYLYRYPTDQANSIKEIISAIESVARVLTPKAQTLGDSIKILKNDEHFSQHLLDALKNLYAYSNATPLIRHGHPDNGQPTTAEAELAFSAGTAFILYLISTHQPKRI